jgi:rubrerythrin
MSTSSLLDAIRVVKENERIAFENYADAATKISNPVGKDLFVKLSEFEKYHYETLTNLENSLQEKGDFIHYAGREFPLPPIFEIKAAENPEQKTVMNIITAAMDLEQQAEKAYAELAAQIEDKQGKEMFTRLSREEHNHYRILSNAYWNLSNLGTWSWERSKS